MAISFTRYVDITSGVGGGAAVRLRDLILRLYTSDPRVPIDGVLEMEEAPDVSSYFGDDSPEAARARFYFGFVSKNITAPNKISFARWAKVAAAPRIYGATKTFALSQFTGISAGSFKLTLGDYQSDVTGINLTAAASLAAVAAALQTAIRAVTAGGAQWTGATVTYNATARKFELVGGVAEAAAVAVAAAATGTPLAPVLGWDATGVFSPGVDAEDPETDFAASVERSNNFGSFAFIDDLALDQVTAVAEVNKTYNVSFMFLQRVSIANAATWYAALTGIAGYGQTVSELADEFPELLPAAVFAATDYTRRNSVQNYMFQQATLTPSVESNAVADAMDAARTNYYGRTQTAGAFIQFYQRGTLMGLAVDPVDMNTFANEVWLKDAVGAAIMSLLLSQRVPANESGRSQLLAALQAPVNQALFNGTISIGKPLNTTQKLFITNLTGDPEAWQQVFNAGYWLDCVIQSYVTETSATEWKAVYTLIYSKDDAIRKVEGSHVLI